jgi:hypothetical protein
VNRSCLCLFGHEFSQEIGGQESGGGILKGEDGDRIFEDLQLSNLHPCSCGEEDKFGAFNIEGYICGVQQDLKGLQDL